MVRLEWPHPAARKQLFFDESSGCSGAEEIAGQNRFGEGESPQANAESLNAAPGTQRLRPALNEWRPPFLERPKGALGPGVRPITAPGPSAFADVPETVGRRGLGTMKTHQGARFEILVDGKPRSYRDRKDIAIESAEFIKSRNPLNESR